MPTRVSRPAHRRKVIRRIPIGPDHELIVLTAEIAPGTSSRPHFHNGYDAFFVVEGEGIQHTKGRRPRSIAKGDTIIIDPRRVHWTVNQSATDPLRIAAVWVLENGAPAVVNADDTPAPRRRVTRQSR